MSGIVELLLARDSRAIALETMNGAVTYGEFTQSVQHAACHFQSAQPRVIGLALDNGPAWAVIDLAAMEAGIPLVPLPFFFSSAQLAHAIRDAGIDCVHTDQPQQFEALLTGLGIGIRERNECVVHGQAVTELRLQGVTPVDLPSGTAKITYTSGTTGNPKGVCLGLEAMLAVANSLREATEARDDDRHLSLTPLSTLLENIAGLYVPLLAGARAVLLPFTEIGLQGAAGIDAAKMATAVAAHEATTCILTPELLRRLLAIMTAVAVLPRNLRFVAVGGAPVAGRLLEAAARIGLPVFEGYGLSECASVVSLNRAAANQRGSAGQPLAHVHLAFAADGEILVSGSLMLGYTGSLQTHLQAGYWPTGDLGFLDAEGYLHITGRKKNVFITSFGRNVAPEWVECELTLHPAIAQAAVFGEGRPWNVAVIVPSAAAPDAVAAIDTAIVDANLRLPDYARVRRWIPAQAPFLPANGQLTPNGRLRRDAIHAIYEKHIEKLYEENTYAVS